MLHLKKKAAFKAPWPANLQGQGRPGESSRLHLPWLASWQRYSHPNKKPLLHAGSLVPWLLQPTGCLKGFNWHCISKPQRSSPCTICCELTAASSQ
jgi:hypothetical protein